MLSKTDSVTKTVRNHQVLTDIDGIQLLNWKSLRRGHTDGKKLDQTDIKSYYLRSDSMGKPHNVP